MSGTPLRGRVPTVSGGSPSDRVITVSVIPSSDRGATVAARARTEAVWSYPSSPSTVVRSVGTTPTRPTLRTRRPIGAGTGLLVLLGRPRPRSSPSTATDCRVTPARRVGSTVGSRPVDPEPVTSPSSIVSRGATRPRSGVGVGPVSPTRRGGLPGAGTDARTARRERVTSASSSGREPSRCRRTTSRSRAVAPEEGGSTTERDSVPGTDSTRVHLRRRTPFLCGTVMGSGSPGVGGRRVVRAPTDEAVTDLPGGVVASTGDRGGWSDGEPADGSDGRPPRSSVGLTTTGNDRRRATRSRVEPLSDGRSPGWCLSDGWPAGPGTTVDSSAEPLCVPLIGGCCRSTRFGSRRSTRFGSRLSTRLSSTTSTPITRSEGESTSVGCSDRGVRSRTDVSPDARRSRSSRSTTPPRRGVPQCSRPVWTLVRPLEAAAPRSGVNRFGSAARATHGRRIEIR